MWFRHGSPKSDGKFDAALVAFRGRLAKQHLHFIRDTSGNRTASI